jgi:hypothetical protein
MFVYFQLSVILCSDRLLKFVVVLQIELFKMLFKITLSNKNIYKTQVGTNMLINASKQIM